MKKTSALTLQEINDLIRKYNSELRKLEYQAEKIQEALFELQHMVGQMEGFSIEAPKTVAENKFLTLDVTPSGSEQKAEQTGPKRRGRKKKSESSTTAPAPAPATAKTGKKGKTTQKSQGASRAVARAEGKKSGYKLSEWDNFILETLEKKGKSLINSEFYELAKEFVEENSISISNVELRGKLTRSLHKLANKRGSIVKVDFPGKGYAYALENWLDANGEIFAKYTRS